ncbi:MAG: hypothetical protein H6622_04355 [Halobacteriovoraceae bacterium]|nr:hypothetical protein [Halobacteriovoraceae bacterium]
MINSKKDNKIILETNLQPFFYDRLQEINLTLNGPIPNESIYYTSRVLERMGHSHKFFEIVEGKVKNKVLGIKLLEATQLSKSKQKQTYQEVGDTALLICGLFSESLRKKLIDTSYYLDLGRTAYLKLHHHVPSLYDVDNFFKQYSYSMEGIVSLISYVFADNFMQEYDNAFLLFQTEKLKAS